MKKNVKTGTNGDGGTPPVTFERLQLASFSRNLRQLRLEQKLTASDLARKVWGTTTDYRGYTVAKNRDRISVYETGRGKPDEGNLLALAEALGTAVEALAPDLMASAIRRQPPAISMTMVEGRPDQVHLVINTLTNLALAARIIALLSGGTDSAPPPYTKSLPGDLPTLGNGRER